MHAPQLHAPMPLQTCEPEQGGIEVVSVCPKGVLTHLPRLPVTLQALHCAAQAFSQQTPSTQKPLTQSLFVEHPWPSSLLQEPSPSQELLFTHVGASSADLGTFTHVPRLPATLHARHVPEQALLQQTESTQLAFTQSAPEAQFFPFDFLHTPLPSQASPPFWLHIVPTGVLG